MSSSILGFGHRMQQGKDTAIAAIIAAFPGLDIRRYAFADALKLEAFDALADPFDPFWEVYRPPSRASFGELTNVVSRGDSGAAKIAFINENKTTLRHMLQFLGTEYRRSQDPLYWVYQLSRRIHSEKPAYALIADMRFLNEFYWVKGEGGITVNVNRTYIVPTSPVPYQPLIPTHCSETALDNAPYDYRIVAGEVGELQKKAVELFRVIAQ